MKLSRQYSGVMILVIVLVALNLRPGLTAVGPVTQYIQADTGLSTPGMGYLASVPVLCMGLGALVTPWVIRRLGLDVTVVVGLSALAVVILVRSFVPGMGLWIGTVGIGLAIGILNTTLPPIIKRDFPTRAATVTGIYSATLTLSSAIAAGIVVPITGATSWKIGLGCWALMAGIGLCAWLYSMRMRRVFDGGQAEARSAGSADGSDGAPDQESRGEPGYQERTVAEDFGVKLPNLEAGVDAPLPAGEGMGSEDPGALAAARRNILTIPLAWAVTAFMGTQSLLFYMFVQWLPEIEQSHGVSAEAAGLHMSFFQIAGLVATLTLTAVQGERRDQRLSAVVSCSLWIIGLAGFLIAPGIAVVWTIIMGGGSGATFALSLTFINTRTRTSQESSRLSGMSQSVGYMIASVGPTIGGSLGDALGWNAVITVAIVLAAIVMAIGMIAGSDRKI